MKTTMGNDYTYQRISKGISFDTPGQPALFLILDHRSAAGAVFHLDLLGMSREAPKSDAEGGEADFLLNKKEGNALLESMFPEDGSVPKVRLQQYLSPQFAS